MDNVERFKQLSLELPEIEQLEAKNEYYNKAALILISINELEALGAVEGFKQDEKTLREVSDRMFKKLITEINRNCDRINLKRAPQQYFVF